MLETICNYIILVSAVLLAITNIIKICKKPVDVAQHHQQEEFDKRFDARLDEKLPKFLDERDSKIREERNAQTAELLEKVEIMLNDKTVSYLEEIERINLAQNDKIELLMGSSRDMLRQNIINLYENHKKTKQLTQTQREFLDECFRDYENEHGNGYIAKMYHRMDSWETIDDELTQ